MGNMFGKVDFIALPTMQKLPPHLPLFGGGTVAFEAATLASQNTQAVNFAGVPALAMPVPIAHASIPVTSLQLVGPSHSQAALLNAGRLVEDAVKAREEIYARLPRTRNGYWLWSSSFSFFNASFCFSAASLAALSGCSRCSFRACFSSLVSSRVVVVVVC